MFAVVIVPYSLYLHDWLNMCDTPVTCEICECKVKTVMAEGIVASVTVREQPALGHCVTTLSAFTVAHKSINFCMC